MSLNYSKYIASVEPEAPASESLAEAISLFKTNSDIISCRKETKYDNCKRSNLQSK